MRYPGAEWRPITVNYRRGGNTPKFMIIHIMQGTLAGSDSWFRDSAAEVSAHFGVSKAGAVIQWVDTSDTAWHAMGANDCSIGVEHEGNSGESLTEAQVEADAKLFAWVTEHHNVPASLAHSPEGSGLAYHALGAGNWGGHPQCPGSPIIKQLANIAARAQAIRNPPKPPAPLPPNWVFGKVRKLAVASIGATSVKLTWSAPAGPDGAPAVKFYEIAASEGKVLAAEAPSYPRQEAKGASPEVWQGGSLTPGKTYTFGVRALAASGDPEHAGAWATLTLTLR